MKVYVLHFLDPRTLRPFRQAGHAGHYVGFVARGVESRLAYHRAGAGSRLLRAVCLDSRKDFVIAAIVAGTRTNERALKEQRDVPRRFCPICRDDARVYRIRGRLVVRYRPHRRQPLELRLGRALTRRISSLYETTEEASP